MKLALRGFGRALLAAAFVCAVGSGMVFASGGSGSGNAMTSGTLAQFAATTSAQLAAVLSDETGSGGGFVRATSPTISAPVITGNTSGAAAASGDRGEVRRATRLRSAAQSMTNATAANLTAAAVTLGPGDWSCSAMLTIDMAATTCLRAVDFAVSKTSATLPSADVISVPTAGEVMFRTVSTTNMFCNDEHTYSIPSFQVLVSATTDLYPVASLTFNTSTMTAYGSLECRRVR